MPRECPRTHRSETKAAAMARIESLCPLFSPAQQRGSGFDGTDGPRGHLWNVFGRSRSASQQLDSRRGRKRHNSSWSGPRPSQRLLCRSYSMAMIDGSACTLPSTQGCAPPPLFPLLLPTPMWSPPSRKTSHPSSWPTSSGHRSTPHTGRTTPAATPACGAPVRRGATLGSFCPPCTGSPAA